MTIMTGKVLTFSSTFTCLCLFYMEYYVLGTAGLGERCDADIQCSDAKSACSQGRCACSEGFIQKNAKCVKSVCPKPDFQFQCDDLSKSPSCIAIYDTCNGIAQCGDGSDERNCVATLWHSGSKGPSPSSSSSSSSSAGAGLPANRVINLSGKAAATVQPARQHASQEHQMAPAKVAPPPPAREKILHKGRQDPGPPPPAPKKSFAENELQARIMSDQQQQQQHQEQQQQQQQRQRQQQRIMRPPPLQKLIDQGYKKVHLPADQLRSSPPQGYWPDENRDEGSSQRSDWSQAPAGDYYYEPYLRSGGQGSGRDLAELFGDRYVDDYNQALYQASDYGSKNAARELALKQQRQQLQQQQQQQYLDMWARRGGEKREEARRRPRPPFPARDMFSPHSADPTKIESGDLSNSNSGPSHPGGRESGGRRRHNLQDKPSQPVKSSKKKEEKGKNSEHHKSKPTGKLNTGKTPITIIANASSAQNAEKSSKPADKTPHPRTQVTSDYVAMLQKSYQQSKIAVVVLGLTLAVTGMALTFFVCRIRRIKNRLRRGKALTSDEADYLINGMYL